MMGEDKQKQEPRRTTKNSRIVASQEEQDRVLKQVLEASKNPKVGVQDNSGSEAKSKNPSTENPSTSNSAQGNGPALGVEKTQALTQSGGPPEKRQKVDGSQEGDILPRGQNGERMILEYPDYDNFPLAGPVLTSWRQDVITSVALAREERICRPTW